MSRLYITSVYVLPFAFCLTVFYGCSTQIMFGFDETKPVACRFCARGVAVNISDLQVEPPRQSELHPLERVQDM